MNAISLSKPRSLGWLTVTSLTLSLWLGASLLLDCIVMPSLYSSGMMTEPDFASAGSTLFGVFNRVELISAAVVLSGLLVLNQGLQTKVMYPKVSVLLATLLLLIPFIYLTVLSPEMSALGLNLDLFDTATVPEGMGTLHQMYWALEGLKISAIGLLLGMCYRT
jgi:uncharacterized membrane protein